MKVSRRGSRLHRLMLAGILAIGLAPWALAQEQNVIIFREEAPSADELADILFPERAEPGQTRSLKTRGIRFTTDPAVESGTPTGGETDTTVAATGGPEETPSRPSAVGFNIQFALDSARLRPETLPYIDRVAEMMKLERTADSRLVIAGHADASGPSDYNRDLSERRAASVRDYLYEQHGIDPSRLEIQGYGEERPLPGTDPYEGVNRRVEFEPLR